MESNKRIGSYKEYLRGKGLDIGSKGYTGEFNEIGSSPLENATGVDLDYPDYDGINLPFETESQDFVHSSHMLEHVPTENLAKVFQEQHRVLKVGGHLVISVPHQFLYERKTELPSIWNRDHKRFYTPASLMREIEESLEPNTYRVRILQDRDKDYDYSRPLSKGHPVGEYSIECVIEKIISPSWDIRTTYSTWEQIDKEEAATTLPKAEGGPLSLSAEQLNDMLKQGRLTGGGL